MEPSFKTAPNALDSIALDEKKKCINRIVQYLENECDNKVLEDLLPTLFALFPFSKKLLSFGRRLRSKSPSLLSKEMIAAIDRRKLLSNGRYRYALPELMAEFEFEHSLTISKALFKDIQLWPILKAEVCQQLENRVIGKNRILKNVEPILSQLEQQISGKKKIDEDIKIEFLENDHDYIHNSMKTDFLFFYRNSRFYKKEKNVWIGGPLDNLYTCMKDTYRCQNIEEYTGATITKNSRDNPPLYFKTPWNGAYGKKHRKMFGWLQKSTTSGVYCLILLALFKKHIKIPNFQQLVLRVLHVLGMIEAYANDFCIKLNKIKPKAVFFELYYSPETMGLTVAAKRNNIATVEVQHGTIGRAQWLSTHWTYFPKSGISILPDYFFVFDQFEKNNIENFQPADSTVMQGISCGILKRKSAENKYEERVLSSKLEKYKYVILWVNQYDELAFEQILELSKNIPDDAAILLRLHPMLLPIASETEKILEKHNITNVIVYEACKVSLEYLFIKVDHIIARYSTVIREALEHDINITIIDPVGALLFEQLFSLSRIEYVTKEKCFQSVLTGYKNSQDPKELSKRQKFHIDFKDKYLSSTPVGAIDELINKLSYSPRSESFKRKSHCLNSSALLSIIKASYNRTRTILYLMYAQLFNKDNKVCIDFGSFPINDIEDFFHGFSSFLRNKKFDSQLTYSLKAYVTKQSLLADITNFIAGFSTLNIALNLEYVGTEHYGKENTFSNDEPILESDNCGSEIKSLKTYPFEMDSVSSKFVRDWVQHKVGHKKFWCFYNASKKLDQTIATQILQIIKYELPKGYVLIIFDANVLDVLLSSGADSRLIVDGSAFSNNLLFQLSFYSLSDGNISFIRKLPCISLMCSQKLNLVLTDDETFMKIENDTISSSCSFKMSLTAPLDNIVEES